MTLIGQLITSIVAALLTALLAYIGFWRQAKADLEKEYQKKFNEKKWDIYTKFIKSIQELLEQNLSSPGGPGIGISNRIINKIDNDLMAIATQMLLIASDDVIKEFSSWRSISTINGFTQKDSLTTLFDLIVKMRKDLGNNTNEMDIVDMLGSLVHNFQRIL